jgi:hypothetical protein
VWEAFVAERPLAILATVGPDGAPHATPVEVIVREGKTYNWVHSNSAKGRNAARGGIGALLAYKGQRGILLRGPIRVIRQGEPGYDEISKAFLDKYQREETYGNDLLVEIAPERVAEWG